MNSKGQLVPFLENNVLPNNYIEITGHHPQIGVSVLLCVVGFTIVFLLENIGSRLKKS
jgi:putative membrane protein